MKVKDLILQHHFLTESTNGWYRLPDGKSAINFEYGIVKNFSNNKVQGLKYWCFYAIPNFEAKVADIDFSHTKRPFRSLLKTYKAAKLPESYVTLDVENALTRKAKNYLLKRSFPIELAKENYFGVCTQGDYANRLIIPIFSDFELKYCTCRSVYNLKPKYINTKEAKAANYVVGLDAAQIHNKVYGFEGVLDMYTWGSDAVAFAGLNISPAQISQLASKLPTDAEIILVHDRGFYKDYLKLAIKLSQLFPVRVPKIPYELFPSNVKDFSDLGEKGKEIVLEAESKSQIVNPRNLKILYQ